MHISYLRTLKGIVAFVYYASLVAIVTGLFLVLYLYFGSIEQHKLVTSITVPIRLGEEVVYGDKGFVVTTKSSFQSSLSFIYFNRPFTEGSAGLYWKITCWYFIGALFITLMLHQVKQIMDSLGTVNVFSSANVVRIRILGGLLLLQPIMEPLRWLWVKDDVIALLKKHYVAYEQGGYGVLAFVSDSFFIGLLLFALAEVFRSGLYLKKEQELTI